MSNAQADALKFEVLGGALSGRWYLALKPVFLPTKRLKKLKEGVLLDGLDPLHLRVMYGDRTVARARLGQVNGREAVHIVAREPDDATRPEPPKGHRLLEGRLRLLEAKEYDPGMVLEFDTPLTRELVLRVEGEPFALGEMVEYDDEVYVRITRLLNG
jgi:flagellar motor switch protein FliM